LLLLLLQSWTLLLFEFRVEECEYIVASQCLPLSSFAELRKASLLALGFTVDDDDWLIDDE